MNKFILGMLAATAITTKEGREFTKKAVSIGNNVLKKYADIDVKSILDEVAAEEKEENTEEEK